MCAIWQYNVAHGCWIGQSNDCNQTSTAWVGGGRDIPAPPPPGGGRDFNDSSWEIVDLPHDRIIGGTYDQSALDSHAYLPLNTTWYRKHFSLPTEWNVVLAAHREVKIMAIVQTESQATSMLTAIDIRLGLN